MTSVRPPQSPAAPGETLLSPAELPTPWLPTDSSTPAWLWIVLLAATALAPTILVFRARRRRNGPTPDPLACIRTRLDAIEAAIDRDKAPTAGDLADTIHNGLVLVDADRVGYRALADWCETLRYGPVDVVPATVLRARLTAARGVFAERSP